MSDVQLPIISRVYNVKHSPSSRIPTKEVILNVMNNSRADVISIQATDIVESLYCISLPRNYIGSKPSKLILIKDGNIPAIDKFITVHHPIIICDGVGFPYKTTTKLEYLFSGKVDYDYVYTHTVTFKCRCESYAASRRYRPDVDLYYEFKAICKCKFPDKYTTVPVLPIKPSIANNVHLSELSDDLIFTSKEKFKVGHVRSLLNDIKSGAKGRNMYTAVNNTFIYEGVVYRMAWGPLINKGLGGVMSSLSRSNIILLYVCYVKREVQGMVITYNNKPLNYTEYTPRNKCVLSEIQSVPLSREDMIRPDPPAEYLEPAEIQPAESRQRMFRKGESPKSGSIFDVRGSGQIPCRVRQDKLTLGTVQQTTSASATNIERVGIHTTSNPKSYTFAGGRQELSSITGNNPPPAPTTSAPDDEVYDSIYYDQTQEAMARRIKPTLPVSEHRYANVKECINSEMRCDYLTVGDVAMNMQQVQLDDTPLSPDVTQFDREDMIRQLQINPDDDEDGGGMYDYVRKSS
jgi:hypothetical protein